MVLPEEEILYKMKFEQHSFTIKRNDKKEFLIKNNVNWRKISY